MITLNTSHKAVEVLCNKKAFVVKRLGRGADPDRSQTGQLTWSLHGGPGDAWALAMGRAGFAHCE